jgi:hypothetical protein
MPKRPGITEKISVSVNREDLKILRKRADRVHDGNLSAVIAEIVARAREQENLEGLLEWLGGPGSMTKQEQDEIDRELLGQPRRRHKKARNKKKAA